MPEKAPPLSNEVQKRRDQRSLAIAFGLATFMLIVFLVTILRISVNFESAQ